MTENDKLLVGFQFGLQNKCVKLHMEATGDLPKEGYRQGIADALGYLLMTDILDRHYCIMLAKQGMELERAVQKEKQKKKEKKK